MNFRSHSLYLIEKGVRAVVRTSQYAGGWPTKCYNYQSCCGTRTCPATAAVPTKAPPMSDDVEPVALFFELNVACL
jgi:hypothetical protein